MPVVSMRAYKGRHCRKPGCDDPVVHRHHRANEKFFLDVLHGRYRTQRWYQQMVERYYQFRPQDTVDICVPHHAEIHLRYHTLIGRYIRAQGPAQWWTKKQAENLMALFRAECDRWLKQKTPGLPEGFRALRRRRSY